MWGIYEKWWRAGWVAISGVRREGGDGCQGTDVMQIGASCKFCSRKVIVPTLSEIISPSPWATPTCARYAALSSSFLWHCPVDHVCVLGLSTLDEA
jgi:hypothetical protein